MARVAEESMLRSSKSEIVVYTTILSDGYDGLKTQPEIRGVDYVCLTDDPSLDSDQWQVVLLSGREREHWLTARNYKALPHRVRLLRGYRWSIWIDGNMWIRDPSFAHAAIEFARLPGLALFPHPDRDCIYDEADFCFDWPKYKDHPILDQAAWYRAHGYPEHSGLFASGVIARDHNRRSVRRLGRAWMKEIRRWGRQDQVSLPYIFWKLKFAPGLFPLNLWDNPWIEIGRHGVDVADG